MGFIDASMEPMLEMFIFETTTLLEQLDDILLESEKNQTLSSESINEIFRIMHTIKGSAAMMGLDSVANLAHVTEDMFFIIREDLSQLAAHGNSLFDLVFSATDYFKNAMDAVQSDSDSLPDSEELTNKVNAQVNIMKNGVVDTAPQPSVEQEAAQDNATSSNKSNSYKIKVSFDEDCQMENIRAFMLISQLSEFCEELTSIPPNPESDSSSTDEIVKNGLILTFKPISPVDDIYSMVESALNVKGFEILEEYLPALEGEDDVQHQPVTLPELSETTPIMEDKILDSPDAKKSTNTPSGPVKHNLINVNLTKLDQLMAIVGEIVITESMVTSSPDLKGLNLDNFHKSTRQLRKLTDELQDIVMSIRMVPLSGVFSKMNRIVRDMGKKLGKDVELVLLGGDTEVDKTINDSITDPFMHIIRNAMDHAIETREDRIAANKPEKGKITISAQNSGGEVVISIEDDGKGLRADQLLKKAKNNGLLVKPESEYSEKEIFNLIMLPGFSTKEVITEFSGRGVGMDVVCKNIEKIGGTISVDSKFGFGTIFTIKIPLTLAIVDGMEMSVGDTIFTLPIISIRQSFKLSEDTKVIGDTDNVEMIMVRGECYPIIRLHSIFNIETEKLNLEDGILIIIENESKAACLFVDELLGEQQVVVKPFPPFLARYDLKENGIGGCTILGDGNISLILDANNILQKF